MFESHESFPRGGRRWSPSGTRSIAGCLLACLFLIPASPKSGHGQTFLRVLDAGPVVADSVRLFGGNWVDLDADGYLDIYTSGDGNQCYRNEGDGSFSALAGGFVERTGPYWYTMALWADFDNDGAPDLYRGTLGELDPIDLSFLGPGPDVLYRNSGPPDFDMTPIAIGSDTTATLTMSWIDYDRDGDVDLSVSCGLGSSDLFYRNDGGGTFTKLDGLPFLNASPGGAVDSWIDYDGDGDEDYYVVNHATPNELYRCMRVETGDPAQFQAVLASPLVQEGSVFDIAPNWADYDNDGDPDLFLPITNSVADRLYRNDGDGVFTSVTAAMTVPGSSSFGAWGDADNDGDLDLFVARVGLNPTTPRYYRNEGDGSFVGVTTGLGDLLQALPAAQAGDWGDYDNDGRLDLYVITFAAPNTPAGTPAPNYLYRNTVANGNHWILVSCEGTTSNRSAIGTRLRVSATIDGEVRSQYRWISGSTSGNTSQGDLRVHFGLGNAAIVDSVIIEWPSGLKETLIDVPADQLLRVVEGQTAAVDPFPTGAAAMNLRVTPNPFAGENEVVVSLDGRTVFDLEVVDVAGRHVRNLAQGDRPAGSYSFSWNGEDQLGQRVPNGVYFVRLRTPGTQQVRKTILVE